MRRNLFIISIAFCFFTSACSIRADNSWVLKKHTIVQSEYSNTNQWTTEATFPSYEQCLKQRDTRIKDDRASFARLWKDNIEMKMEDLEGGISSSGNIGGRLFSRTHSYACFETAVAAQK